jgi:hypothetical protein
MTCGEVSDRERFWIEGYYYLLASGDLEKAEQSFELWKQLTRGISYLSMGWGWFSSAEKNVRQ